MNLYEYQRSRSFIDLGPRSLRFNILNLFFLDTARQIEAKFHRKPPWTGGTKVCSNSPGHMTYMAAMPIYCKNLKKIFFSGTKRLMTLKVGLQHWKHHWDMRKKWLNFGDLDLIFKVTPALWMSNFERKKSLSVCTLFLEPNDGFWPNFMYCIIGIIKRID